jgi:hypothetical protein
MKWPRDEHVIDIVHDAIYSIATPRRRQLIAPTLESRQGLREVRATEAAIGLRVQL